MPKKVRCWYQTVNIIAVDWAKDARKRSAYQAELATRTIARLPFDGTLAHLIEYASSLTPPVLVGIDAAIGFPILSWKRLVNNGLNQSRTFVDYLLSDSLPSDFFDPVTSPGEWTPRRPFIRPPAGPWSLKAFVEASDHGLYRQIDTRFHANPIFVTSGIPGSVGSGTRALWREIIALKDSSAFHVWPFHGPLEATLKAGKPVIAEIYPKACYGIALAESLPAPLLSIAKTRKIARQDEVAKLQDSNWLARERVTIADLDAALANEDDFDALLSAAALMRMFLENAPLESPDTVEVIAEGGMLGAASLTTSAKRVPSARRKESVALKTQSVWEPQAYPCPIPECAHVFHKSRGGWDAHVASLSRHPHWHPKIQEPVKRKLLFKQEFPDWFKQ